MQHSTGQLVVDDHLMASLDISDQSFRLLEVM